jgi:hypothetical protein
MPMPLSLTSKHNVTDVSLISSAIALRFIDPALVNLTALERRFTST